MKHPSIKVSLAEARRRCLQFYWTGKPCSKGHVCFRRVTNRNCVKCNTEQSAAWYADPANAEAVSLKFKRYREDHLEYERQRNAAWREANPDLAREITRNWRARNEERFKANSKAWWDANPERAAEYRHAYRARKKYNGGQFTAEDVLKLFEVQDGKCVYCHRSLLLGYDVDHIIALKLGGANDNTNIQLLCPSCNSRKSALRLDEFMRRESLRR